MYCRYCGNEISEAATLCMSCGVPVGKGGNYCPICRAETASAAVMCPSCGASLAETKPEDTVEYSEKSSLAAGLLGLFLGGLGVHNFYLKRTKRAVAQLCLFIAGILLYVGFFVLMIVGGNTLAWSQPGVADSGFVLIVLGFVSIFLGIACLVATSIWSFVEALLLLCGSTKTDGTGKVLRK